MSFKFFHMIFNLDLSKKASRKGIRRKLELLNLEERVVPATFMVVNNSDSGTGSLRQAIINANATSNNDIINFTFASGTNPYTITMASALPNIADAGISGTLTINGLGASSLIISGNDGNTLRDFNIFNIDSGANLAISGVTVSGAKTTNTGKIYGGAFNNTGTLTITNSTISGNVAGYKGGGIFNNGSLTITNSTLSGNTTSYGGGVYNSANGNLTISNSTISGNSGASGAAINNKGGTLNITNSTISGNSAFTGGGGIYINGSASISNSTISGNSAFSGGGLYAVNGTITLINNTISGNSASNLGGGIHNQFATINIANTIIANNGNTDYFGSGNDTVNLISPSTDANNIVSKGSFSWATTKTSSQINLGPLQNNGGPTLTMALQSGSAAIGAGDASISDATPINGLDQRGAKRNTSDIGAYSIGIQVTTTADSGAGSLRQAITDANNTPGNDYIGFNLTGASPYTITLSSALPNIVNASTAITGGTAGALTINGPSASSLTISGDNGNTGRDFNIFSINTGGNLAIFNTTVSGAQTSTNGGALNNSGTLTVNNSIISGNSTSKNGGAFNNSGTLTVNNSTISGNSTTVVSTYGGAIANSGTLNISNSTLSNNSAFPSGTSGGGAIFTSSTINISNSTLSNNSANRGGGIDNFGTSNVSNSTLFGNSATSGPGGAIFNFNAKTLNITNSTLSDNSAPSSNGGGIFNQSSAIMNIANTIIANSTTGGDYAGSGTIGTNLNNLVEDGSLTNASSTPTGSGNISGDPLLGPLQINGGPTLTMALLNGSIAISAGNATISNATPISGLDQRGAARPSTTPSIGAYDFLPSSQITLTQASQFNNKSGSAFTASPIITFKDANGVTVTNSTASVTMTVSGGDGKATTVGTTTIKAVDGAAIFFGVGLSGTNGQTYTLTFTSGSFTATQSAQVVYGNATQLIIKTSAATSKSGIAFTTQPAIFIKDAFGNTVSNSGVSVNMAVSGGDNKATTVGTVSKNASGGTATFSGVGISGTAGTSYTLTFTSNGLTATTQSITPTFGNASKATLSTNADGSTSGSAFTTQPIVKILDAFGNTITTSNATVSMSVSIGASTVGTTSVSAVSGVATFTNVGIKGTAGFTYGLTFASSGLTSATQNITPLAAANTPTFGTPTATADGFTVQITNYDANFTYAGTATAGGTVAISNTGLVTVTGVSPNTSSTATITTTRTGYANGSAPVTATSLLAANTPVFGTPTPTADGFTVQISNYDSNFTYAGNATASGTVAISNTGLVTVSGVAVNTSSTATITTTRTGYASGSAPVTATSLSLLAGNTPTFGTATATADGFTVQISNYDSNFTYAGTATAGGTVAISNTGLVTVTGVSPNTSSTATITTTRTGYANGSAPVTATSLLAGNTPAFSMVTATADGFTVQISNYDANFTYAGTATASGTVSISNTGLVSVSGVAANTSSTATITTTQTGYANGSAPVTATSLDAANTPTFGTPTATTDGFTVQISNYDANFSYAGTANAGSVSIDGSGLVTVSGVAANTSSTATITTTRTNYVSGSAPVTATSLNAANTPVFGTPTATADGFIVQISNYSSTFTYSATATAGSVSISVTGFVTVTGISPNTSSTATITTTQTGFANGSAPVTATSLFAANTPAFGTPTATADGFTVQISNYDSNFTIAGTATAGSVSINGSVVTVTGVSPNTSSTATITTTRPGYADGFAQISATGLNAANTPAFGTPTATADGFTVQISNYDSNFTIAGTATASGTVSISNTGLVSVSGVAANTSSTATITTTQTGFANGSAPVTATSLLAANTPAFGSPTATADGFTVLITNYDANFTYAGTATVGSVSINGSVVTVTGVSPNTSSTATITTTQTGYADGSAPVTATSLNAANTPVFGTPTATADGFTVQISNYDANFTYGATATVGSVSIGGSGLVTVTGVAANTSSTATITTTQTSYVNGSAPVTATSLNSANTPTFGTPTATADGFTVLISNYDANFTYAGTATAGSVSINGSVVTVTGVSPNTSSTATITTIRPGYADGSAQISATGLNAANTPTFGTPTATADGFTVLITNYDANFTYGATATVGSVSIGGSGLVTVTGVAANTSSTASITTTQTGYADGSAPVTATSLNAANTPVFGTPTATADGFTVQISNYDSNFTYGGTATAGSVSINGSGLVTVSGVAANTSSTATITTTRTNYVSGSAPVTATSITSTAPLVTSTPTPSTGQSTTVTLYDPVTNEPTGSVAPFPGFTGNISVTSGDFNRDGIADIIAGAGVGGGPAIAVLDSQTGQVIESFFAFDPAFTGGVNVAIYDVNNDGIMDIIAAAGAGGGPEVRIFNGDGLTILRSFFAYDQSFSGGVSVATIDLNNDGILDIVTGAGAGGAPHVKVFDGATNEILSQWFAYPISFTGGVFVAVGDISNDGNIELVTGAGQGGTPVVAVWDPLTGTLLAQFYAYAEDFTGGARVGVYDGNGDGILDLITGAGPGGAPEVKGFNFPALDLLFSFYSGDPANTGGVYLS
jgi:hypothetical protein